jgi:uncharacterized protein YbjT (DUF2867 family)
MKTLVTGATGNIGARVVARLLERGERPRIFVRDAAKARARFGERVDVSVGDLQEPASMARALVGVEALFLVTSGPDLEHQDASIAKVAKASGVRRVVKLSSADAAQQVGTGAWHARGEAAIRATGIPFVFVRPTGFMDNALFWARSIKSEGVVRSSTGEGKIPFIHSDDIADVATRALVTADHVGECLSITGPEALSYAQMSAKIGAALGKRIAYEALTEEDARRLQAAWGDPTAVVDAHQSIYRAIREGRLAEVTDTVERVLGRAPIPFDRWVEQHLHAFQ